MGQGDFIKVRGGKLGANDSWAKVTQPGGMQAKMKWRQRNGTGTARKWMEVWNNSLYSTADIWVEHNPWNLRDVGSFTGVCVTQLGLVEDKIDLIRMRDGRKGSGCSWVSWSVRIQELWVKGNPFFCLSTVLFSRSWTGWCLQRQFPELFSWEKQHHWPLVEVWVYSLPPPPRFRLFTVFFHAPAHSKALTSSHKTHRCVVLQQAGKKEEVAGGMLNSGFHLISGCRICKP